MRAVKDMMHQDPRSAVGLSIQVVSTEEELVKLRLEWDRILHGDSHSTVFQSWEWAFWNWSFRKAGKRLYVLAVRDARGTARGIAPFWIREVGLGRLVRICEFMGTRGAEYLDFIAERDWLKPTIESCVAHLEKMGQWSMLDFQEIPENSPTLSCLRASGCDGNRQWVISPCSTCVRIPLPQCWDAYRAMLGPSSKKRVHYEENRLRALNPDFRVIEGRDPDFTAAIATVQELHQARRNQLGDVGVFQADCNAQLDRSLLQACGERGWTKLFLLSAGGEVVAGFSGFEFRNVLFNVTFAINPEERWLKLSVGNVLLKRIIRWGIERGLTAVDLTRGNEPYKLRFGGISARNYRSVAYSSSFAALMGDVMDRVRSGLDHTPWLKRMYAAFGR